MNGTCMGSLPDYAELHCVSNFSFLRGASRPEELIVAAEPKPGDAIMGLRSLESGYIPPILDTALIDRRVYVTNRHSVLGTRALASVRLADARLARALGQ